MCDLVLTKRLKFPSDRKKISSPGFASAEFVMILIFFGKNLTCPLPKQPFAFLSS